jgi:hypothetical protein
MIRVLEIVNQLGEVFDRVNIVVRGRGDESHARESSSALWRSEG